MRITELHDTFPQGVESAGEYLSRTGWVAIGAGYNAEVWGRPDRDYVVKLFERDRAYLDFLKLVQSNPNKHFPKIKGRVYIARTLKGLRMEKLYPQKEIAIDEKEYLPSVLIDYYLIYLRDPKVLDSHTHKLIISDAIIYMDQNPELKIAAELINDKLLNQYSNDVHGDNVMQRSDGTVVIIDPVMNKFI